MDKAEYKIVVGNFDKKDGTSSRDLLFFLAALRATYVQLVDFLHSERKLFLDIKNSHNLSDPDTFRNVCWDVARMVADRSRHIRQPMASFSNRSPWEWALQELPRELDLTFTSVSTNSPLKFVAVCTGISVLALSITVCLAGGKADLGTGQVFEVHSLIDAGIRLVDVVRKWQ